MFIVYFLSFSLENNQSFSNWNIVNIYICCFEYISNGKFDTMFLNEQNNGIYLHGKLHKYAFQFACKNVNLNQRRIIYYKKHILQNR